MEESKENDSVDNKASGLPAFDVLVDWSVHEDLIPAVSQREDLNSKAEL